MGGGFPSTSLSNHLRKGAPTPKRMARSMGAVLCGFPKKPTRKLGHLRNDHPPTPPHPLPRRAHHQSHLQLLQADGPGRQHLHLQVPQPLLEVPALHLRRQRPADSGLLGRSRAGRGGNPQPGVFWGKEERNPPKMAGGFPFRSPLKTIQKGSLPLSWKTGRFGVLAWTRFLLKGQILGGSQPEGDLGCFRCWVFVPTKSN